MTDVVPSETVRGRSPSALARTGLTLATGTAVALNLMRRLKPAAVIGFGGYPTLPPLIAARLIGIPTVIHDSNAVMGRANRFLSRRVSAIATSLPGVLDKEPSLIGKTTTTGTPMRPAILAAATVPFAAPGPNELLRMLVVGGSQGARVMSDIVPGAIEKLGSALWQRLILTQQVRDEDMARVRAAYDRLKIEAELAPFFADLPGAAGLKPSHHLPLRRGHGGRTRRHWPSIDSGAAARCDRSGSVRQCRRVGRCGRCDPDRAIGFHSGPACGGVAGAGLRSGTSCVDGCRRAHRRPA